MQFGSDNETEAPSLIIDGVRLPFRMQAQVVHGPLEEDRLVDAAGMDRLPVMLQVMLPRALCPPAAPLPALPAPEQARPGLAGKAGTQGPGDVSLLPGSPERHRPVSTAALESLRLGKTLRQRVGGPPSLAGLRDPAPAAAADAGDPADLACGGNDLAVGTGRATGTSGYRALDVVFSAGRVRTLHRAPPASPAAARACR